MILKTKVGVAGCMGRMGQLVSRALIDHGSLELKAGSVRAGSDFVRQDLGQALGKPPLGMTITSQPQELFQRSDCVIDFSHSSAMEDHLLWAQELRKPILIALTGLSAEHHVKIKQASRNIPILYAANTSLAINLMGLLVEKMAGILPAEYMCDITEVHHRHKRDAPSGTSKMLAESIRKAAPRGHLQDYFYPIPAQVPRPEHTLGYNVRRGGGYTGDHSVVFASDNDAFEITHRAFNRQIYVDGTLKAAEWLVYQPSGLYGMRDVLNSCDWVNQL